MFEIKTALICKLIAKHLEMLIQWLFVREKKKLTWSICQYLLLTTDTWFCWRWNIYILISKPTHIHIPFCTNISAWFFVLLLKGASEEQFVFWGRIWTGQPLYKSSATEKTEHWSFPSGEIDFETSPFFDWCGESNIFSVSPRRIVTTMNSTEQKNIGNTKLFENVIHGNQPYPRTTGVPRVNGLQTHSPRLRHNPGLLLLLHMRSQRLWCFP